jgi:hypothetical protein
MKQCLHSKKGIEPEAGSSIKLHGEGDCYNCEYDPEENKNCRKFYEIEIKVCDIK